MSKLQLVVSNRSGLVRDKTNPRVLRCRTQLPICSVYTRELCGIVECGITAITTVGMGLFFDSTAGRYKVTVIPQER